MGPLRPARRAGPRHAPRCEARLGYAPAAEEEVREVALAQIEERLDRPDLDRHRRRDLTAVDAGTPHTRRLPRLAATVRARGEAIPGLAAAARYTRRERGRSSVGRAPAL